MPDYQIYRLAKQLGQPEQFIKDNYSFAEVFERGLFDSHDNYISSEMQKI